MDKEITYGIFALHETEPLSHQTFTVVIADRYQGLWKLFVKQCNTFLEVGARYAHSTLVKAAIGYTQETNEEKRDKHANILWAFLGDDYDINALGHWTLVANSHTDSHKNIHVINKLALAPGSGRLFVVYHHFEGEQDE